MCCQGLLIVLKMPQAVLGDINNLACLWQIWCLSTVPVIGFFCFIFFPSLLYLLFFPFFAIKCQWIHGLLCKHFSFFLLCFLPELYSSFWMERMTEKEDRDSPRRWLDSVCVDPLTGNVPRSQARLSIIYHPGMTARPFQVYIALGHHQPQSGFERTTSLCLYYTAVWICFMFSQTSKLLFKECSKPTNKQLKSSNLFTKRNLNLKRSWLKRIENAGKD